jgi:hypothetical protein
LDRPRKGHASSNVGFTKIQDQKPVAVDVLFYRPIQWYHFQTSLLLLADILVYFYFFQRREKLYILYML